MTKQKQMNLIRSYLKTKEEAKQAHIKADVILTKMIKSISLGKPMLIEGKQCELVDNFATANVAFRAASMRRYDVKVTKAKKT